MVDFLKLAKGQQRGGEPLVTNSNVVGGNDLFKNFDQKMSQINLGGFDSNIRPVNALDNQANVSVNPENYIVALEKQDISQINNEIEISMDYMLQNEQYIEYQRRIKQLLRETECDDIGDLLSKHGDSRKVIDAMFTLQKTFDADSKMKQHYQKTMTNFKNLNTQFNGMRDHIHRGELNSVAAVQTIATNEYSGNVAQAAQSYKADMAELNDMRNEAINNINETLIPFVDDQGKYVVNDFENNLKQDQLSVKAVAEIDINKPQPNPETIVESTQPSVDARDKKHEHDNAGPSL